MRKIMNKENLKKLEALNQIRLNDMQKEDVLSFFAKREEDVRALDEINTKGVKTMVHVMPLAIELREDVVKQIYSHQELQVQAPQTDAGYFCVPRVID